MSIISERGIRQDSYYYHKGDGFYYNFSYDIPTTIYFVCVSSRCNGRAKMLFGGTLEHTVQHNHMPDLLYHQICDVRHSILDQARELKYVSFSEIVQQQRSRVQNRDIRARLTYRSLRPAMQRARSDVFPRVPANLRELTALHQDPSYAHLTQTTDSLDSIYCGSVDALDGSHSVIYISQRSLQVLREVSIIFADGTFSVSPSINNCYQVFTIVTAFDHTVIPLMWCLMERKTEAAYISVLVHLRVCLRNWNFMKVICDFEDAMINAFRSVFDVEVQSCYFHYVSAQGKWACTNISIPILRDNPEVVDVVRHCCALPLLPRHLLERGYEVIVNEALDLGLYLFLLCFHFLCYVKTSWLEHPNRSQTLSVAGSAHRTNNCSESNNRRMNRLIQLAHPGIFHLIHEFKQFEDSALDDLNSLVLGRVPTRHRHPQSISNDENIIRITNQLMSVPVPTDQDISTFLHSAAVSVENVVQYALGLQRENPPPNPQ